MSSSKRPVIPVKVFLSHQSSLIPDYTHFNYQVNSLSLKNDLETDVNQDESPSQQSNTENTVSLPSYFDSKQVKSRKNKREDESSNHEDDVDDHFDENDETSTSTQFKYAGHLSKIRSEDESLIADLIHHGFSVILYGFGSKRVILDNLMLKFNSFLTVCIHGYFSELTTKHILTQLKEALDTPTLDLTCIYQAVQDSEFDHILIMIHSLDRLILNNGKVKDLLVLLGSLEKVQLIATVDHVNSQLLFTNKDMSDIRATWVHLASFNPYTVERGYSVYGTISDFKHSEMLTISAVSHVYDSLTPNAQRIFCLIIRYYLDKETERQAEKKARSERLKRRRERNKRRKRRKNEEQSEDDADEDEEENDEADSPLENVILSFSTLYRMCREEYMANSDTALKTLLTEFEDHDIVKMTKSSDGSSIIRLRISLEVAKAFLERIEE